MDRFSIIILFSLIASFAQAGEKDTLILNEKLKYDTNYITSKRDWVHIKFIGVNNETTIDLINTDTEYSLSYKSNSPYRYGIGFDYEWIALEFSHTIPGLEFNSKTKGSSETFAIRLGLSGRKFRGNLYYRETKGFSHENIEQILPDWFLTETQYPYSENLHNTTLNASLYYTFNHRKFSNTAAIRQIDQQIKSAGSAVIGFVSNFEGIYSPNPIILHDSLQDSFLDIKKAEYLKAGITGGYMYTFSFWKNFYIHAALVPGLLYSYGDVALHNNNEEVKTSSTLGASIYSRFTLGYNANRFYGGMYAVSDYYASDAFATQFATTQYTYLKFFIGYRFAFKKRKWMKNFYL